MSRARHWVQLNRNTLWPRRNIEYLPAERIGHRVERSFGEFRDRAKTNYRAPPMRRWKPFAASILLFARARQHGDVSMSIEFRSIHKRGPITAKLLTINTRVTGSFFALKTRKKVGFRANTRWHGAFHLCICNLGNDDLAWKLADWNEINFTGIGMSNFGIKFYSLESLLIFIEISIAILTIIILL